MIQEKTWDNIQDGTKLILSIGLLFVSPNFALGLKIGAVAVGLLNRAFKIGNIFADKKGIWDKISLEQKKVFEHAWEKTRLKLDQDTQLKIISQIEAILKIDLEILTNYTPDELEQAFNNSVSKYKRFAEWNAQASDIVAIFTIFMKYYDEEVMNTIYLKNYYNGEKINDLIAKIKDIEEHLSDLTIRVTALESPSKNILYSFSNEDNEYYFAWLRNYIDNRIHLYTNTNILSYHDDNIYKLNSRFDSQTWKQEVISSLQNAKSILQEGTALFNKVTNVIRKISGVVNYDVVYKLVYEIAHSVKWNKELRNEFANVLKSRYNKLAVVTGEPGSGKTHFLREYLKQVEGERNNRIFAIPLECGELIDAGLNDNSSLDAFLLNKINDCFNIKLENLSLIIQNDNYRIVFIIDNFQKLFIYSRKLFSLTLYKIEELTKYDYIYWLVTLNDQDSYILNNNMNIIQKYCIRLNNENHFINYTFNLTLINESNSLGEKIISLYNKKICAMDINDLCRQSGENFYYQPLNNPLHAHIIGKFSTDEVIPYVATYLDFIIALTQYIDYKLKEQEPSQFDLIRKNIVSIVDKTLDKGSIVYSSIELTNISPQNVLNIIRDKGLLRWLKENDDVLSLQHLEDYYELYTSIYWAFKMVLFLLDKGNNNYIGIYGQLCKLTEYRNELIPCFLLCLDKNNKTDAYRMLFLFLMKQHDFHYALFCSHKASIEFKKEICYLLLKAENTDLSASETFGLLYFLYYYNAKTSDEYTILSKYIHVIHRNRLLYNLDIIISKSVEEAKDLKKFKRDIKPFFLVDIDEVNYILGYKLGTKYYYLIEKDSLDKQINDLKEYINNNGQAIEHALESNNRSFIDFFLRGYFTCIINGENTSLTQIYNTMEEQECFYKKKFGIILRRNLSCAAGNIYERSLSHSYCTEYLNLVQKIVSIKDERSYAFAFHFISNSISDDEGNSPLVATDFIPILEMIWSDPKMEKFCKGTEKRRLFFEVNIYRKKASHFEELT